MPIKLNLDSQTIYNKEFAGNKAGYDSLQVDTFLDIVIKDYQEIEKYISCQKDDASLLGEKIKLLTSQLSKVEAENALLRKKIDGINLNQDTSLNNLELLKRISSLEKALSKAGINPNNIE